jgi:hypothetical protein
VPFFPDSQFFRDTQDRPRDNFLQDFHVTIVRTPRIRVSGLVWHGWPDSHLR